LHGPVLIGSAAVIAAAREIKEHGLSCDVLVVDTLFHSSAGANLAKPEELLPVFIELQKLVDALQAKTCVLVHHTTKDGETYYGTVVFEATLAAMILFKKTGNELTKPVSCMRMREDEAFKPFDIRMQTVVMETKPDQFGRTERVMLSVVPGTAPAQQSAQGAKLDKDMELMRIVLVQALGNSASSGQWCDRMRSVTEVWKEGKKVKEGWSEATFYRRLEKFKERHPELKGDGLQGGVPYEMGEAQPDEAVAEALRELAEEVSTLTPNHSHSDPLQGSESGESGWEEVSRTLKHSHKRDESGSSQGSVRPSASTETDEELGRKVSEQLGTVVKCPQEEGSNGGGLP
jgi:hypothetical protein